MKQFLLSLTVTYFVAMSATYAADMRIQEQHIRLGQQEIRQGKYSRALARFRWLLLEGSPDRQTEVALQNTIATITNENPLRFSLGGALLPSTNIANGSSHRFFETDFGTFRIDSAEERKSGV